MKRNPYILFILFFIIGAFSLGIQTAEVAVAALPAETVVDTAALSPRLFISAATLDEGNSALILRRMFSSGKFRSQDLYQYVNAILNHTGQSNPLYDWIDFEFYFQRFLAPYATAAINADDHLAQAKADFKSTNNLELFLAATALSEAKQVLYRFERKINTLRTALSTLPLREALRSVPGSVRVNLDAEQEFALSVISEGLRPEDNIVFVPEQIFFISALSFARQVFDFDDDGSFFRLSRNPETYMIFIDNALSQGVEVTKVLLHELLHQHYTRPGLVVANRRAQDMYFFNILEEVEVERHSIRLMKRLTREVPRLRDAVDRYVHGRNNIDTETISGRSGRPVEIEDFTPYILRSYVEEAVMVRQFKKTFGPGTQKALNVFMREGDPRALETRVGPVIWPQFLLCISQINDIADLRVHRKVMLNMLTTALRYGETIGPLESLRILEKVYWYIDFISKDRFSVTFPFCAITDSQIFLDAKLIAAQRLLNSVMLGRAELNFYTYFEYVSEELRAVAQQRANSRGWQGMISLNIGFAGPESLMPLCVPEIMIERAI